MDVNIGINTEPFDSRLFSRELLFMMRHFQEYLDDDWSIKKKNSCYILTKNKHKLIISDSIYLSKTFSKNNKCSNKTSNKPINHFLCNSNSNNIDDDNTCQDTLYLLYFMYNVLNNGWIIKKSNKNSDEYVFIKNHEGKQEYFSNKYIHTFLKENFNFNLIK